MANSDSDVDAAPSRPGSAIAQGGDAGHTPGPWVAAFCDEPLPKGLDRDEVCILPHAAYDAVDIFAPAREDVGPHSCGLPEFEANVRLIAAAPEMFEALTEILATFGNTKRDEWLNDEGFKHAKLVELRARAAIAKATGARSAAAEIDSEGAS